MRKLASIKTILDIRPIEGADRICTYYVGGWSVVDSIGKYKVNDPVIIVEIDSWVPNHIAPFLTKEGKEPKEYKGIKGEKIRSIKLRGQISQGLLLPLSVLPNQSGFNVGDDVTKLLNIEKYDPPIPAEIVGDARSFNWPIEKTDETRIQCDDEYKFIENLTGKPYYISLKLDGTSSTFLIDPKDEEYHVCGRNFSYKAKESHSFWQISERYEIERKLRSFNKLDRYLALQGEIVGPGIQKNPLGLKLVDLYIFNVVNVKNNTKLPFQDSKEIVESLGLKFVPVVEWGENFSYNSESLLEKAKGKYAEHFETANPKQDREGIVVRSWCGKISFKVINNDFLLKNNDM